MNMSYDLEGLQEPERSIWAGMRLGYMDTTFTDYKQNGLPPEKRGHVQNLLEESVRISSFYMDSSMIKHWLGGIQRRGRELLE